MYISISKSAIDELLIRIRPSDPIPVKSRFVFHAHDQDSVITEGAGAARAVELLYSMIRVSSDGRKTAIATEISEMKNASQTTASPDGRETATAADISELNREAETITKQHQDERRLTWQ